MKIVILLLLYLLFCVRAQAQEQVIGTIATTGTQTQEQVVGTIATIPIQGTLTDLVKPYPVALMVTPKEIKIKAGEIIEYIVKVRYSNGDIRDAKEITYQNLPGTKQGNYNVTIIADGLSTIVKVTVIPNEPVDMIIKIGKIDYGTRYKINDRFQVVGIDKYDNHITELSYSFSAQLKQLPSKLFQLLNDKHLSLPDGNKVSSDIFQSGILIMPDATFVAYDLSDFIGTITLNGTNVSKTFTFTPQISFSYHELPFKIVNIDTSQYTIGVNFYLQQMTINRTIRFPSEWFKKFSTMTLLDVIEVICYINLLILQEMEDVYKSNYSELLRQTIFKPFLERQ